MKQQVLTLAALILFSITSHSYAASDVIWEAGVAKRDITPQQPIRLSGYASRSTPTVGVSETTRVNIVCECRCPLASESPKWVSDRTLRATGGFLWGGTDS